MKKMYNAVASEYEMPELTPTRYLKCETIDGRWWYKDMKTGEDLPMFTTPIDRTHYDTLTFNQEKVFNEYVENIIDPITQCQVLQSKIDKALVILEKSLKNYCHNQWEGDWLKLDNPKTGDFYSFEEVFEEIENILKGEDK